MPLAMCRAQVRNAGQVDAVFLAVRAPQARLLAPQLALAGAGGATRVGTSQLTVGSGKVEEDVALDGIVYPNEAWNVRSVSGLPSASQVASTLPSARGAAGRLFAFGADAWKITAYLDKLSNEGGLDVPPAPVPGQQRQHPAPAGMVDLQWRPADADRRWSLSAANVARRWKPPPSSICNRPDCSRARATCVIAAVNWTW